MSHLNLGLFVLGLGLMLLSVPTCLAAQRAVATTRATGDRSPATRPRSIRVVIVGDSTVATYPLKEPLRGWGQMLPEFFAGQVKFINLAVSARSSKSFRTEGRWREALAFKPDYIFIQFGHNDCPGKGLHRETDPNTTYADNLRQYIQEARAIHAVPILVTPMERRVFKPDGRRIALSLKAYAEAVRRVAKETQTPVIDLHRRSVELFERLGDKGGMVLNSTPGDRTHFSEKGARLLASFIVEDLSVSELKQWVMPKPKLKTKSK